MLRGVGGEGGLRENKYQNNLCLHQTSRKPGDFFSGEEGEGKRGGRGRGEGILIIINLRVFFTCSVNSLVERLPSLFLRKKKEKKT